jgi:hypothetical protein
MSRETLIHDLSLHALEQMIPVMNRTLELADNAPDQFSLQISIAMSILNGAIHLAKERGIPDDLLNNALAAIRNAVGSDTDGFIHIGGSHE